MPYVWTEPDVLLSHQGVKIDFNYQDDGADNPPREFWYGFFSSCADDLDEGSFDIREVEALLPAETRRACRGDHRAFLMALIDAGFLTAYGFMIGGYLCDNANSIRDAVNEYAARQQTPQIPGAVARLTVNGGEVMANNKEDQ